MGDKNENNPFILGAKKQVAPIAETVITESVKEVTGGDNPFLLKKKDQSQLSQNVESTVQSTPSQLDSAGSTSELEGSTSGVPQKTEAPFTITGEDLAAKTGAETEEIRNAE